MQAFGYPGGINLLRRLPKDRQASLAKKCQQRYEKIHNVSSYIFFIVSMQDNIHISHVFSMETYTHNLSTFLYFLFNFFHFFHLSRNTIDS